MAKKTTPANEPNPAAAAIAPDAALAVSAADLRALLDAARPHAADDPALAATIARLDP